MFILIYFDMSDIIVNFLLIFYLIIFFILVFFNYSSVLINDFDVIALVSIITILFD